MSNLFTQESDFGFNELFFSRTDLRGIIESGNSVFQRVSKYEWNEILRRPHNLIRHPAMPKGVFHLLWETILSNKPIGAYVVNKSKDGSYYWVFALVIPIKGGFLSIRLKPSSAIFEIAKKKYAELLELEKSKKLAPKESQAILLQVISELKYQNYRQFMIEALTQELESRQIKLGKPPIAVIAGLRKMLELGTHLQKKCEDIFSAYQQNALVPLNLQVQVARIGDEAAPIAVISSQYKNVSVQIQDETHKFMESSKRVQEKVENCQLEVCTALLQKEMHRLFKEDKSETPIQKEMEMELLTKMTEDGVERAKQSLNEIDHEFRRFRIVYEEVRKLSTALEIVSVSGQIEVAKVKQLSGELTGLLNDLAVFKASLKTSLKEIDTFGKGLTRQTQEIRQGLALQVA